MIRPEVLAFADDIRDAIADANATLSLRRVDGEPGSEPAIALCIEGTAVFWFRRDEFLEAMYVAGCDAMEKLERQGRPFTAAAPASKDPIQ